jgi:glycosyltransferase involved in cell wall biosynthesis
MAAVFLNGRFLGQKVTGVQRFSAEVMAAIDRLVAAGEWPDTAILAPRCGRHDAPQAATAGSPRLPLREVGRLHGHLWEQTELAAASRGGLLVSLGNTAPVLAGRRQVVVVHDAGIFDTPESYSLRFRTWYKAVLRGLAAGGAQIVTVSDFSRRRIAARLGVAPARIAVMREGAEHVLRTAPDPTVLQRHGLAPGKFALVVGSRVAHKNLGALLDGAALLAQRGLAVAVAGGVDPDVFRRNAGAGAAARQLGRVSDAELRALYENAICLLFPSRYEGFGLPPVEAMACGCPVLAARGGAVEEICTDHALYFDGAAPASVAAALARLLDTPDLAGDLRRRGRAHAATLTWTAAARVLAGVVRRLH